MRSNTLLDYGLDAATPVNTPTLGSAFDVIAPCPVDLSKLAPAQVTVEALREQADRLCKQMGISQDDAVSLEAIATDVLPCGIHEYTYAPTDRHYQVSMEGIFAAIGRGLKKLWEMICNFFRWVFRLDRKSPANASQKKAEQVETKVKEVQKAKAKQDSKPPQPTQVKSPTAASPVAAPTQAQQKHDDERAAWSRIQQLLQSGGWYDPTSKDDVTKSQVEDLYNAVVNNAVHFTTPKGKEIIRALQDAISGFRGNMELFEGKSQRGFGVWAEFEAGVRYTNDHSLAISAAINTAWTHCGQGLDLVVDQVDLPQAREAVIRGLDSAVAGQQRMRETYRAILMNTPNDPYTRATDELGGMFEFRARMIEHVTGTIAERGLQKRSKELDARLEELKKAAMQNEESIAQSTKDKVPPPEELLIRRSRLARQQELLTQLMQKMAELVKFEREQLEIINNGTLLLDVIVECIGYKLVINECRLAYT